MHRQLVAVGPSEWEEEVINPCDIVERLGHTSCFFDSGERYDVAFAAAAVQHLVDDCINRLLGVALELDNPALLTYMSDGWSTDLTRKVIVKTPLSAAQRSGRFKAEFLSEKAIFKTIGHGDEIIVAVRVTPPVLMDGKSGWDIFQASLRETCLRLRLPDQICVTVYLSPGWPPCPRLPQAALCTPRDAL